MNKFSQFDPERITRRLLWFIVSIITIAGLSVTLTTAYIQYQALPQIVAKVELTTINKLIQQLTIGVRYGFEISKLREINYLLDEVRRDHEEIGYITLIDKSGKVLALSGNSPSADELKTLQISIDAFDIDLQDKYNFRNFGLSVVAQNDTVGQIYIGQIYVGINDNWILRLVINRFLDVATVLVVVGMISTELLMLLLDFSILAPIRAFSDWRKSTMSTENARIFTQIGFSDLRSILMVVGNIGYRNALSPEASMPWDLVLRYIRFSLFLFIFGDSICISFIPLLSSSIIGPEFGSYRSLLLTTPVAMYTLIFASVQLFAVSILYKFNHKTLLIFSAILSISGYLLSATTNSLAPFLIARSLNGAGLGLAFLTLQTAILSTAPVNKRTTAAATFTSTYFLGTFSGIVIGGIASQEIGYEYTFILAIIPMAVSALFGLIFFGSSREIKNHHHESVTQTRSSALIIKNIKFSSLVGLCAIPNRMFNTALLYYLAPLFLGSVNFTKSEIGRAVSLYGLIMALFAPIAAIYVDKWRNHELSVILGSLICALGALTLVVSPTYGVIGSIVCMGIGQALSVPSQIALVPEIASTEVKLVGLARVMSLFRLGERLPAFLAPLGAQFLIGVFGYSGAINSFSAWLFVSTVLLYFVLKASHARMHRNP